MQPPDMKEQVVIPIAFKMILNPDPPHPAFGHLLPPGRRVSSPLSLRERAEGEGEKYHLENKMELEAAMISDKPEILLVEDDLELREALTEALAIHGFSVAAAGSGLEFYQLLKRRVFAVALIDLGLPDLDGFDLVAYLRQNTTMKIIIITSQDDLEARVKGYQAGADLYLTKPAACCRWSPFRRSGFISPPPCRWCDATGKPRAGRVLSYPALQFLQLFVKGYQLQVADSGFRNQNTINKINLVFLEYLQCLAQVRLIPVDDSRVSQDIVQMSDHFSLWRPVVVKQDIHALRQNTFPQQCRFFSRPQQSKYRLDDSRL